MTFLVTLPLNFRNPKPIIAAKAPISLFFTPPSLRGVQRRRNPEWRLFLFWIAVSLTLLAMTGTAFAATSIPFTINTSEAVNVTGTPRIAVDVGGVTRYATYTSGSGTNALTFTYAMVAGDVDLDGVALSSPIQLNGGTIKDLNGNDATLTFTPPNTSNVKVNYPSLGMDFVADADGRYTLNGTVYNDLSSFLTAAGGTFTRASTATYFDSTGTLQTATTNQPRFDYDPVTHAAKGILVEENRTNAAPYSSQLDSWATGSNYSSQTNSATSPDGALSAERLAPNTSNSWHAYRTSGIPVTSGQSYTASAFFKADGYFVVGIDLYNNVQDYGVSYNLSTGTLHSNRNNNLSGYGIQAYPNGWYRIYLTFSNAGTATDFQLSVWPDSSSTNWNAMGPGNGASGAFIWGAQLEQGTFPTSYIPTTTVAVTRSADVFTIPESGWFNNTAGTVFHEHDFLIGTGINSALTLASFNHGTSADEYEFMKYPGKNGYSISVPVGGSYVGNAQFNSTENISDYTATAKMTSSYTATQSAISSLGASPQTATRTLGLPAAPTNLFIGRSRTGVNYMNGHMRKMKYYPFAVTNTQLQLLAQ